MAPAGEQDRPQQGGDGGPGEAASYLEVAVGELAQLARRHRLDMLAYLLEMACLEAGEQVRLRQGPSNSGKSQNGRSRGGQRRE
uniref:Uncharacterized protein n=1 Tax=Rhodopseudomonas palustris (strain BisA53) TaxID=316055 RepID=Q07L74_RHOP5